MAKLSYKVSYYMLYMSALPLILGRAGHVLSW